MKFLSRERLSQHKYKTPEGYLICVDSVLARTGKQTYHRDEVFHDGDDTEIEVDRRPDEVFSEQTLASFENKPITVEHPDCDVTCENYKDYAVGFVRDVKRGIVDGQDVILGTLVIQDAKTIDEIEAGEHVELSCGYDCDIKDEENPQQRNIRGNHVALCEQGRAGNARIVDTAVYDMALSRTDAMDRCISLGKRFIEHFDKIYKNPNDSSVQHWKGEMKGWLDSVKEIKLKNTNKPLLNTELHDWFFTAGANVGDFIKSPLTDEITAYDKFIVDCLSMGLDSAFKNIKYEVTDSMKTRDELTVNQFKSKIDNSSMDKNKLEAIRKEVMASRLMNIDKQWLVAYINSLISDLERMEDSIDDEISEAYKKWFKLLGDHSNDKNALQKDIVLIMKDRELSYVEADELLKRAKRFTSQQDSVNDASEEYDMILRKINRAKGDMALLEDVRRDVKASDLLTEDEKNRLLVIIRSALSEMNDSTTYEEATKNLNKGLKKFTVEDEEGTVHIVKAKTVQDALKKVNDYRDLNAMTNAILQCNKDMASAKDKAVEYLACKSQLEDIVNQADPKVKEHWKTEKDNWLKAIKAKYHV